MSLNASLQKLSPSLLDRLSKEELKSIAEKHDYVLITVKRMLRGQGARFRYSEDSIKAVVATALELMRSTEDAEALEQKFKKYIAA